MCLSLINLSGFEGVAGGGLSDKITGSVYILFFIDERYFSFVTEACSFTAFILTMLNE